MEIIDRGGDPGHEPVQVAFADTREEAALIRGLLREGGIDSIARQAGIEGGVGTSSLLTRSPRRIYVRPENAVAARALIAETMVENPAEAEIPEPVNAAFLDDASGHRSRGYGVVGAYARACLVGFAIFGLALVAFQILH